MESTVVGHREGNVVMVESVKCFRKTSDEAPEPALNSFQGGGGKNNAPLALLRLPALRPVLNLIQDLFQGCLLLPVLALGGLLLITACQQGWTQPLPDSVKGDTVKVYIGKRNPWAALGLSMVCPGAGQLYNHQKGKGLLMMCLYWPAAISCSYMNSNHQPYDTLKEPSVGGAVIYISLLLISYSVGTWSIIDAPLTARNINWKNGYTGRPKQIPMLAFGFSFVLPGAGQLYNGQRAKAAMQFTLFGTGIGIASASKSGSTSESVGGAISMGTWVWSMVDAPLTARRINRGMDDAGGSSSFGLVFIPDPRNPRCLLPGVGLRAGF